MKLYDNGSLEIGISNDGASTGLKITTTSSSITGYTDLICEHAYRSVLHVYTTHYPQLFIRLNSDNCMEFNAQTTPYSITNHHQIHQTTD